LKRYAERVELALEPADGAPTIKRAAREDVDAGQELRQTGVGER